MLAYVCFIHFITFANMKLANIAKLATAGVGLSTLAFTNSTYAAVGLDLGNKTKNRKNGTVDENLVGTTDLVATIQNMVQYLIGFCTIVAVLYGIYGGYLYLTSGGEEEQTKKAKTIFKQVAIGILIIFLAYSAVTFFQSILSSGATADTVTTGIKPAGATTP